MSRVVVKCGGAVAASAAPSILGLVGDGHSVCVVHGAGPQISGEMRRRGIEVEFVHGRRVTTTGALEVVRSSFEDVNRALCSALGSAAVGLFGDEIGLAATPIAGLGLVGEPLPSSSPAVEDALRAGRVPVVAPLAAGPLNVNADEAAAALAIGMGADRLVFVTDVAGLLHAGAVVEAIGADDAERLLASGELDGGILPKLGAAVTAARQGVAAAIGETAVLA